MKNVFKFLLLFLAANLFAQNNQRFFQKIEFKNNTAEISVNDGLYQVKFYTPEMVETAFIPKNQTLTENSHAVILSPKDVKYNFRETRGFAWIETSGITLKIQKVPFQISYYKGDELLISEKNGYGTYENGEINNHPQNMKTKQIQIVSLQNIMLII